jgi:hypothetical protein
MGFSGFVSLAFLLIVMVICWIWGEQGLFTKLGFTGITLACSVLYLIPGVSSWILLIVQAILIIVIGGSTSGWQIRRRV